MNRKPGDIDFWVVRENTEGEYSAIGGRAFPGTEREMVVQETVFTRVGVDRVLKFAFELAQKFSRFYAAHHVLNESNPGLRAARLELCGLALRTLIKDLDLLGIEVPERM